MKKKDLRRLIKYHLKAAENEKDIELKGIQIEITENYFKQYRSILLSEHKNSWSKGHIRNQEIISNMESEILKVYR